MIVHSRMRKHPDFRYSDPLSGCIPTFNLKKYGHARYRGKGEGTRGKEEKEEEKTGKEREQGRKGAAWGHVSEQ